MAWVENITFTNDSMNARSRDAFATAYGWSATLPDGSANPETKAQHRARRIKEYIKAITRSQETAALQAAVVVPATED